MNSTVRNFVFAFCFSMLIATAVWLALPDFHFIWKFLICFIAYAAAQSLLEILFEEISKILSPSKWRKK